MAKFQVGIAIRHTRSTVIIVEVEAADQQAAERLAEDCIRAETRLPHAGRLRTLDSCVEWDTGVFSCLGVDHEALWGNGEYASDLVVPKDSPKRKVGS